MLKEKTVLVTGSTSGIGLGIAESFAKEGSNVIINGFGDRAEIDAIVARLAADYNIQSHYNGADMSKPEEIRAMVAEAHEKFGSLDVLINNAGIQHTNSVEEFSDTKWDAIIAINMSSNFHAIKAALPKMRENGFGRIINVASAHGLVASKHKAAYVAAKHGVVGLTKVVGLEVAEERGVTCNAICPGWVLTPLVQKQIDDRAKEAGISVEEAQKDLLGEKQPSLQFTTVEQLGGLAIFLCSPAADNITGAAYNVDGGWLAQ